MSLLIKKILSSIKNIYAKIDTINSKIENTRWKTATLTDDFKPYGNDSVNIPLFKKTGNQVEIIGSVSPMETIPGSTTPYTIFTLPEGYRPSNPNCYTICHGSGKNTWLLRVQPTGEVTFSRYGVTSNIDAENNVWLIFDHTFFVD